MTGVKGRSGGARPGVGRPKKDSPLANSYADPLAFLQAVWTGKIEASAAQARAATAALPFKHRKPVEGGTKKDDDEAGRKAAGGWRWPI